MKLHYFEYCFADRVFYDEPNKWSAEAGSYPQASADPPEGWKTGRKGPWFSYMNTRRSIPKQGWKIHVSARRETAGQVLDAVSEYCISRGISFKFLVSEATFIGRNLKYADRGGSGKFVTIYPADDGEMHSVLNDLDPKLEGLGGPYILSDLRWREGPLYFRYGGFVERLTRNEFGEPAMAIENPAGELVIDRRDPVFSVPEWVDPPAFLASHLKERESGDPPPGFPYQIESAVHFSNGGGIYIATDARNDRKVILKEARPNAGLDQVGRDAVTRLKREYDFLCKLADLDSVVNAYEYFELWEHHFLVQEFIDGVTLNKRMVARTPLIKADPADADIREYAEWVLDVTAQIDDVVGRLHDQGIAFGDLHPNNIMITEDGHVKLVDFELATHVDQDRRIGMGAPGFVPPDDRESLAADRFALGCLKLAPFVPLTVLFTLDTTKAALLVDFIESRFPVPEDWGKRVHELLDLGESPWAGTQEQMEHTRRMIGTAGGEADWPELEASMARALWNSATPERTDRLFPGDVEQFNLGGIGMGYGAAGVLYALAKSGHGRSEEHEEWLLERVRRHEGIHRVGFYDGLHGVAFALEEIGNRAGAREVLDVIADIGDVALADELHTGLSGVALNQLYFANRLGDSAMRAAAVASAGRLAERLVDQPPAPQDETGKHRRAGLLYGASGSAVLFVRLFEETGDAEYLDLAERAVRHELDCCLHAEDEDVLYVNEGWRSMPYIGVGSAGVGLAIAEVLRHRADEDLAVALQRLSRAAFSEFHICPMLFYGTAGQMGFLQHVRAHAPEPGLIDERIALKRDRLRLHMVGYRGEIAFPGDQLMRLSMDFGTGTAGILHALYTVRDPAVPLLPFLAPFGERAAG